MIRLVFVGFLLILSGCAVIDSSSIPLPTDMAQTLAGREQPRWDNMDTDTKSAHVQGLLPSYVKDSQGWAKDLVTAYDHLDLPHSPAMYCASIAVIQQESSFRADPTVPGLGTLVMKELQQRADKFFIPDVVLNTALDKPSPGGETWRRRIEQLRTERELNTLFEDMLAYLPFGQAWLEDYIPVRTAGPMQVSIQYAKDHVKHTDYPYTFAGSLRNEVFTRRGGVYFGVSILMDYPLQYTDPIYRFADFNAGRYASRNAAFQAAISQASGTTLVLDGDLLRYHGGVVSPFVSNTEKALRSIKPQLDLTDSDIRSDLRLEKQAEFSDTRTYNRTFRLAQASAGKLLPRAQVPGIKLKSPKITSNLTTAWFANKVKRRFNDCLARSVS